MPRLAQVVVPQAQGAGVVQAEILHMVQVHIGFVGDYFQHLLHRGQRAAGEDIALDKVDAVFRLLVALVADGDGLQQHQAVGLEQLGALLEIVA